MGSASFDLHRERLLTMQYATTRVIAEAATIDEGIPRILQAICETLSWDYGAVWIVDPVEHRLRCSHTWHLPQAQIDEFETVSRGLTFLPGVGLPGRVWKSGEPAWIPDVLQDSNFPRAPVAGRQGLHGAFGFPILLSGTIHGALEFFSREIREPDEELLHILSTIGGQIGHFIERRLVEEEVRDYAKRLETAHKDQEEIATRLAELVHELNAARGRAESATRAKSEFLANMSHEIRTPLHAVIGMTQLTLGTRLTRQQREYLDVVEDSAEALLALINDILDFSKIEERKLDLDRVAFTLRDTVEDTVRLLALRAQQKGLELACRIAPEIPERLVGDPGRLRQIIVNLLGNAIKFTDRGEVVLEIELLSQDPHGVELYGTVKDTGIGVPREDQARIFEAFAQGDSSTTRQYGGTGLGLSITTQLVQLMNGRIWMESEPSRGSTFHFTARLERAAGDDKGRPVPIDPSKLRGLRVLVVDDNATNRRILGEMLSNWKLDPTLVDGAPAALAALEGAHRASRPFHLILLDAQMPGMDGYALARRIPKDRGRSGPTLILLTSAGLNEPERVRRAGIHATLLKPVKQSDLLDTIVTTLGRRAGTRERALPKARGARPRRLRVLLVEDNRVNQTMALRILEKRGHQVTVAENGQQALELWSAAGTSPQGRRSRAAKRGADYDVVLMDVQMPVMNGLEATSQIRAAEQRTGGHTPIVAMTAHAMQGDRERCLAAGMDGYLVKPIQADELSAAVESFAAVRIASATDQEPVTSSLAVRPSGSDPSIAADAGQTANDAGRLAVLNQLGGDVELAGELAAIFLEDRAAMMQGIEHALASGDPEAVRAAAHTLKGAVSNFGAESAVAAALDLERIGWSGSLGDAGPSWVKLQNEVAAVENVLLSIAHPVAAAMPGAGAADAAKARARPRPRNARPTPRRAGPPRKRGGSR